MGATKRVAAKRIAAKRGAPGVMAVALAAGVVGCSSRADSRTGVVGPAAVKRDAGAKKNVPRAAPESMFRLIGDGSTAFMGSRPKQPVAQRLAPGQKLAKLGTLDAGQAPAKGWTDFLDEAATSGADADRASGAGKAHAGSGADQAGR